MRLTSSVPRLEDLDLTPVPSTTVPSACRKVTGAASTETMAFTCRSNRPADAYSCNPGPGTYSTEQRAAEHGYAPFLSTAARKFHPDKSASPGPGRYAQQQSTNVVSQASLSAPFSTSGPRLGQHKSTSAVTPGPGYYSKEAACKWGASSRRCVT